MIVQTLNEKIQVYLECTLNSCPFLFPHSFATKIYFDYKNMCT